MVVDRIDKKGSMSAKKSLNYVIEKDNNLDANIVEKSRYQG